MKRQRRKKKRWGHKAPEYPLKTHENENCSKHSKNPMQASFTVLLLGAGSDSDLDSLQPNRIPELRGNCLMITDIERALLSDPCDPQP